MSLRIFMMSRSPCTATLMKRDRHADARPPFRRSTVLEAIVRAIQLLEAGARVREPDAVRRSIGMKPGPAVLDLDHQGAVLAQCTDVHTPRATLGVHAVFDGVL